MLKIFYWFISISLRNVNNWSHFTLITTLKNNLNVLITSTYLSNALFAGIEIIRQPSNKTGIKLHKSSQICFYLENTNYFQVNSTI